MASTRQKTSHTARAARPKAATRSLPDERAPFHAKLPAFQTFTAFANDGRGVQVRWEYDAVDPPTGAQHAAYAYLEENAATVAEAVVQSLIATQGRAADAYARSLLAQPELAPLRELSPEDLRPLLGTPDVFVLEEERDGVALLGFLVRCAWRPDRALDVVVHRAQVVRMDGREAPPPAPLPVVTDARDAAQHQALGNALSHARRYAEAEASFRSAIALAPALAMAHNNLGWVLQMRGDAAGALDAYREALRLDASLGRARRNLAALLSSLGRHVEAVGLWHAEARARPDDLRAFEPLIGSAMLAGDLALASEAATRYAELRRGSAWYPAANPAQPAAPTPHPTPASASTLTPSKLQHDIDQFHYLQSRGILAQELAPVIDAYETVLAGVRPLGDEARVPMNDEARRLIGGVYKRIVHHRPTPRVARALSGAWDATAKEAEYLTGQPNVVVIDRFLSDDAIQSLRAFCLESTVWTTNRYRNGRLGAFFRDGFNTPLLIQIAEELREALPRVIGVRHPLRQLWGFKYATLQPQLPAHADFAAVNVNFWITPDAANLAPGAGGLVLYDVKAPKEWDFETYNTRGEKIQELLTAQRAQPIIIPYGFNRAVIFDSDLFHTTPALRFATGYENRRINVTLLFGDRHDGRDRSV